MRSNLENFLVLFTRLKKETNNLPSNLKWLPAGKPHLISLCYDLGMCDTRIQRYLMKKESKHMVVPDVFTNNWDEYNNKWKELVKATAEPENNRIYSEFRELIESRKNEAINKGSTEEEFWNSLMQGQGLHSEIGDSFDPLTDDPTQLINTIECIIHDDLVNNSPDGFVFDDKSMGAWLFFQNIIGINYTAIYSRWRSAPELFIPEHMLSSNISSIVELYNEAVRAFIFGLSVASVAMCRALMEHILKKHYHIQGADLENIISIAEKKHDFLKGLNLQLKRKLGNTVLHKYEKRTEDIDQSVKDFLLSIRHLVTNIPQKSRRNSTSFSAKGK